MQQIIIFKKLHKASCIKEATFVYVFPHSSWLEQNNKCYYSVIASSAIVSENLTVYCQLELGEKKHLKEN